MGMGMGMNRPRTIDAGTPPARFARGWHCLGLADSFRDGDPGSASGGPRAVQAFGTKLVVFADSAGTTRLSSVSWARCRNTGSRSATAATTAGSGPAYAPISPTSRPFS